MSEPPGALGDVVARARLADPSIETLSGVEIARHCARLHAEYPDADAAELARRCVAAASQADASWVVHIARATLGQDG